MLSLAVNAKAMPSEEKRLYKTLKDNWKLYFNKETTGKWVQTDKTLDRYRQQDDPGDDVDLLQTFDFAMFTYVFRWAHRRLFTQINATVVCLNMVKLFNYNIS